MDRTPELQKLLDEVFGNSRAIGTGTCADCKGPAVGFKDLLSIKEYSISGLCQDCQDKTFHPDDCDCPLCTWPEMDDLDPPMTTSSGGEDRDPPYKAYNGI